MLQSMRENSQSIIARLIVGFIIVTFALWGVNSLVGLASAPDAPVKVNGVEISERQIQEGIELQRRQIQARMGENADPSLLQDDLLRGMVVQNLIEQSLLLQRGADQGMAISDQHLDTLIRSTPDFQVEGQFDPERFSALLRNVGFTPLMYRDYLRKDTLIAQDRNGIVATAFALPAEAESVAVLDRQTRDLSYLTFDVASRLADQTVEGAEVEAYYAAHQDAFMSEEQVSIAYIELNKADLAQQVEVDEAGLQSQYQHLVDGFQAEEARDASHILIQVGDQRDDAQAQALVKDLAEQIKQGADFAALARQYSEDPGSAADGGELGVVEKGVMVPEFEQALFALGAAGDVSAPVHTDFGYHLIKLNRIEHSEAPSFDEARPSLVEAQRKQKAESLLVSRSEELADVSFSAADLREPAESLGLQIHETGFFGREGGEDEVTRNPQVLRKAFDTELRESGTNSEVIELDPDHLLVLRIREYHPSKPQSLDEVREQIVKTLETEKARAEVLAQAGELLKQVRSQGLDALGEGYHWTRQAAVGRGDAGVSEAIRSKAFSLPRPAGDRPSVDLLELDGDGAVLVAVTAVNQADLSTLDDNQRKGLAGFLASREGLTDYQEMLQSLKTTAQIERR